MKVFTFKFIVVIKTLTLKVYCVARFTSNKLVVILEILEVFIDPVILS